MTTSKAYIPHGNDGWSTDDRATATCFCGDVQLSFPTEGEDLVTSFLCNCTDDRKVTGSMFASNFVIRDTALKHERGEDKLTKYAQSRTIATGDTMENSFCSKCGTLMYRRSSGFPGLSICRIGTVDDFNLHETKLKPKFEQFTKDRASWLDGGKGIEQMEGNFLVPK